MSNKIGIMICRSAADPLKPGYVTGHKCESCGNEVQVSPTGIPRMQELYVVCMPCGLAMTTRLEQNGKQIEVQLGPGAIETAIDILMRGRGQQN